MDLVDQLRSLAARAAKQVPMLGTEEATKNALVMPFINSLGYNVFDPAEVTPELCADVGVKKGEKVDYAILKDGEPAILFECKQVGTNLDRVTPTQLFRYFTVTKARIAVLTDGILYRFFSDLEEPNKMDARPFLQFDLLDFDDSTVGELKKLSKAHFDQDAVLEAASELKYMRELKGALAEQLSAPSDEFVRFFVGKVYSGRMTQAVKDQFTPIVQRAFRQFITDQVTDRLKSALARDEEPKAAPAPATSSNESAPATGADKDVLVTTEEEREGYHIVKAILRETVDPNRIAARDVKTYFGILLDDNNRRPIARLHFNTFQKYVGLFDNPDKQEERVPIESLNDLYQYADRLKATIEFYK